jgi:hypothetical protein
VAEIGSPGHPRLVVSASADRTLRLRSAAEHIGLAMVAGPAGFRSVAGDGETVVAGSDDGRLWVMDVDPQEEEAASTDPALAIAGMISGRSVDGPQAPNPSRWSWQFWVAVVILLGFGALVVYVMRVADQASDPVWQRRIYVFSAVEALVFTAIGWLFGREVNRSAVVSAQQDAAGAKKDAETARVEARQSAEATTKAKETAAEERAKGRTLAVVAANASAPSGPRAAGSQDAAAGGRPAPPGAAAGAAVVDLRSVIQQLYPPD